MEVLYRISENIKQLATGVPGATNISDNWGAQNKKVGIDAREGFTPSNLTSVLAPQLEALSENWSPGYFYELGREEEQSADAMRAVASEFPLVGFIIVLLLMLQFNSFRKSTIVLLTIPLGLIGSSSGCSSSTPISALWLSWTSFLWRAS